MKLHERSTQRFVKEYANWKVSILKDMAKWTPDEKRAEAFKGRIYYIEKTYSRWKDGIILTDEAMKLIAEA